MHSGFKATFRNLRRATEFLTRRRARRRKGPRLIRRRWFTTPLIRRGRRRPRSGASLPWLVLPPLLFALLSVVVVLNVGPEKRRFGSDIMWPVFGATSIVLAIRSAAASAPFAWRAAAFALSLAFPVVIAIV